ncbi:MAG: prepilin-type N-terminal cleavage/methylation domain-containing protein [Kiritimatiellales bacterium]
MKNRCKNRTGFTLVELLLAVSLSIMVFAAMGLLLSKCFSLWKDSTAQWRLSQYARISRERILSGVTNYVSGGVTNLTGLLAASNAVVTADAGYTTIAYNLATETGVLYQIRGWPGESSDKHLQIKRQGSDWVYALSSGSAAPEIKVDLFSASYFSNVVTISYRLQSSVAGKPVYQPVRITTSLLNEE